jgi:hypothetical protein
MDYDHIDPRYEENRPYQLVCGFHDTCNREWIDPFDNKAKSNRFLPWRVSTDSVGSVPCTRGDLCLFLDPDSGNWVLEEFLGDWWFLKTKPRCGPSAGGSLHIESGHAYRLQELGRVKGGQKQGPVRGRLNSESGLLKRIAQSGGLAAGALPWWVNEKGETCRRVESPGPEWQNGRKFRQTEVTQ